MSSAPDFRLRHLLLASSCLLAPLLPVTAVAQAAQPEAAPAGAPAPDAEAQPEAEPEVETVVVRGRFIPDTQRQSSEVVSVLTAGDLARTGDDTAAAALTRLSGLSVVSDRFVYVRGLGDRYSSALLNGSPLASPEPLRRQVPLDLFPSNILNSANVQKTFSTNYPGEFGGGIIDLRTLRRPREPFLTLKAGTAYNTESTGQTGFFVRGTDEDWIGRDNGLRDVPAPLAEAIAANRRITDGNFSDAQLERIGESLVNSPLTVIQRGDMVPDVELEMTGGTTIDRDAYSIGLIGVVGYSSEQRTKVAERVDVVGNVAETRRINTGSTWDIVANVFGSASVEWGDNSVALTGLLVRSTSKDAFVETGTDVNLPANQSQRREGSAWYERELRTLQLAGDHTLGNTDIAWRLAIAESTREAPYEREVGYAVVNGVASFQGANLGNSTRFSDLADSIASAGVDLNYNAELNGRELVVKWGFTASNTERDFTLLTFAFTGPRGPTPVEVLRARVDFLFSPDNISPRRWVLNEQTGRDDAYLGELVNRAAYVSVEHDVTDYIRATVGLRYEEAEQRVATFNRFGDRPSDPVALVNDYVLPALTVTWNFADDLQFRAGYSQTIARPQFRELAFTPYIDPDTDRVYQGNPFLTDSTFQNYDARLEWYFGNRQFVTGALFYKTIENPIEEVIVRLERTITRFINAPEAQLWGVELEYRDTFEMPFSIPFLTEPQFLFNVNYTYTSSEVVAPAGSTVVSPVDFRRVSAAQFGLDGSQLQGTPEHIANLQFGFETERTQLTLIAGYVSERIARRGLGALPSVFDDPGVNLDLVFKHDFQMFGQDLTLGMSARNLLDQKNEEYQISGLGRTEANTYARGSSVSLSLGARW
jgi:outer membrane receptor protein involved in Fe transport